MKFAQFLGDDFGRRRRLMVQRFHKFPPGMRPATNRQDRRPLFGQCAIRAINPSRCNAPWKSPSNANAHLFAPARMKLEDPVSARAARRPQVTRGTSAFDFRVLHLDRRFIHSASKSPASNSAFIARTKGCSHLGRPG